MRTIETKRIGEFAKVKGGKRLPIGMEVQDELTEHPYLRIVDFSVNGVDRSSIKYISNEAFEFVKRYIISNDDVYISIAGTIGRVGIVPADLSGANLTENAAKITEIDSTIDKNFLMYFLRSSLGQGIIQSKTGGTSQPKLALFRIEEIEVPFLLKDEQKRIAEILSAYDDLIENNLKRIRLLEESARLLYREWFVRLKFPNHEHTPLIDGLPEGWSIAKLKEVCNTNERSLSGSFDGEIEYIDISCVTPNSINDTTFYDFKDAPSRARRIVKHGDIIWSCVRPNRKSHAFIWNPSGNLIASTGFAVISPEILPTSYLYFAVTKDSFVGYLENRARGAAYPAVTAKDFEEAEIIKPSEKLISSFDEIIAPIFSQTYTLRLQNQKLKQARDLLLPRLMSGEIAV